MALNLTPDQNGTSDAHDGPPVSSEAFNISEDKQTPLNPGTRSTEHGKLRNHAYRLEWKPDVDLLSPENASTVLSPPTQTKFPFRFDQTAFYYMDWAISKIPSEMIPSLKPHLRKMYFCMKKFVNDVRDEKLKVPTAQWLAVDQTEKVSLRYAIRDSGPEGYLMCLIGRNLPFIMRGDLGPWALLNSDRKLDDYFMNAPRIIRTYDAAGKYLKLLSYKNPKLSILEIGAGTGGSTLAMLKRLGGVEGDPIRFRNYDCTDVSISILRDALGEQIAPWKDLVTFRDLDIDNDPTSQGYTAEYYDVIVAAYTLHSSKSVHTALQNARKLLKSGGKLLILDVTREHMASSLIFGTLPSWWAAEDANRQESPVMSEEAWEIALLTNNFSGLEVIVRDDDDEYNHQGSMMVSTAKYKASAMSVDVLVICEENTCGISLLKLLKCLADMNLKFEVSPLASARPEGKICVVLSEHTASILKKPSEAQLETTKKIFLEAAGILWVTRGADPSSTDPHASLATGFARAARAIRGQTMIATLDLGSQKALSPESAASTVFSLFKRLFLRNNHCALNEDDNEYAERDGQLLLARLVKNRHFNQSIVSSLGELATGSLLDRDASYLLVGESAKGTARWMIDNGARNFIFNSVGDLVSSESGANVEALEYRGVSATVGHCDITNAEALTKLIEERQKSMLPIRGIIYGDVIQHVSRTTTHVLI